MGKILTLLLLAALFILSNSSDCFGEDCAFASSAQSSSKANISQIISASDKEVRRVYWYYLRKANMIYQANIDTPERYLSFFIYRNVVGTFLCITSWYKTTQLSEINTFVRLGNGYSADIQTPYSPVAIDPFIISLRLAVGEVLIEVDANGNFIINGKIVNITGSGQQPLKKEDIDEKSKAIDNYVVKAYWQYLRDATLIHTESVVTTQRVYAVLTYINIVGTFLVIGSCDSHDIIFVNTLVRLGAGADSVLELKPIAIEPSVITLA